MAGRAPAQRAFALPRGPLPSDEMFESLRPILHDPIVDKVQRKTKAEPVGTWKGQLKRGYEPELEPLTTHGQIFEHMTARACEHGLFEAMEYLQDKTLRVATMCSGTDSPIMALERIAQYLFKNHKKTLHIHHVFSCEIEPEKARFIERNTGVPLIFRDVRELAFNGMAATHYGAGHPVPQNLDIVIAGFSCKDVSRVNPHPKELSDMGESGKFVASLPLHCEDPCRYH